MLSPFEGDIQCVVRKGKSLGPLSFDKLRMTLL
jgi:hypothetical protein